jgi:hypothetical protein
MSKFIQDKARECAEEVARLDALIADLTEQRTEAESARLAFLGVLPAPAPRRRRQARRKRSAAPPPPPTDRAAVRLRVGTVAARTREKMAVRSGERVPVDRVED